MKITFTTFILLHFLTSVSAQTYKPMIEPGKQWNYTSSFGYCGACACHTEYGTFYFDNDTLINGLTYRRVLKNDIYIDCGFPYSLYEDSVYVGAMREDSQRVYFFALGDSMERLHFDFNLNVGDTLPSLFFVSGGGLMVGGNVMTVLAIDSIMLGDGLWHKKYQSTYHHIFDNSLAIIEGIGAPIGGIYPMYDYYFGIEATYYSTCSLQNELILFQNDTTTPCQGVWSGMPMPQEPAPDLSIFPNPSSQNVNIQIPIPVSNTVVQVYDYSGRMVRALPMNSNEIVLERNGLPAGLYWVRVLSENGLIGNGKVVFIGNP